MPGVKRRPRTTSIIAIISRATSIERRWISRGSHKWPDSGFCSGKTPRWRRVCKGGSRAMSLRWPGRVSRGPAAGNQALDFCLNLGLGIAVFCRRILFRKFRDATDSSAPARCRSKLSSATHVRILAVPCIILSQLILSCYAFSCLSPQIPDHFSPPTAHCPATRDSLTPAESAHPENSDVTRLESALTKSLDLRWLCLHPIGAGRCLNR